MTVFNKERAIVAQNSATAAASIVASLGVGDVNEALEAFGAIREFIFDGTLALADGETGTVVDTKKSWGGGGNKSYAKKSYAGGGNSGGGQQSNDGGAGVEIRFGKYSGSTIAQVYETDPEYIQWLSETSNNDFIKGKTTEYLATVAA